MSPVKLIAERLMFSTPDPNSPTVVLFHEASLSSITPLLPIDPAPLGELDPLAAAAPPLPLAVPEGAICQAGIPLPLGNNSLLAASCVEVIPFVWPCGPADDDEEEEEGPGCRACKRVLSERSSEERSDRDDD